MGQKQLLLFTSDQVADTGKVSYQYILQIEGAYEKYPRQCFGPFGVINKTNDPGTLYLNLFKGSKGLILAAPLLITAPERKLDFNQKTIDNFPDACNMLCTKEIADIITPILTELGVEVLTVYSKETLLTAYNVYA